ncbi:MAG: carbohydrate kinase [Synechococcus sp.]|nr:carbohydrate kinase [Synechococcus sp.]
MTKQIVIFGEALWDIFPDGSRNLGGAPFNVAWHLQAFGMNPLFISCVGSDPLGEEIQQRMLSWGMNTRGLQIDPERLTGQVKVTLHQGQATYDIQANCAYDFIDKKQLPPLPQNFLLYHGSLALRNSISFESFSELKNQAESIFFDINLRAPWWEKETILHELKMAYYLKLNDEELTLLSEPFTSHHTAIEDLFRVPRLQQIILTQGAAGANFYGKNGDRHHISPETITEVVDTVGAGDAFCSVFLLGLISDWLPEITLERAQIFASAIVGIQGAVSQDPNFYRSFIEAWN